jgi:hypothetical protein
MFFRRKRPAVPTFADRLDSVRKAGLNAIPLADGRVRVSRGDCVVELREVEGRVGTIDRAGLLLGGEIAALVDGGYQKFFRTTSGLRKPATAAELQALHDFEEDLKEAVGAESYYNDSLGTVSAFYQYDRVTDRDAGAPKRAWE